MSIDFTSSKNRNTYALRTADESWQEAMVNFLDPRGMRVADIGCGGGIYSTAWLDMGAESVVGVDFSGEMIKAARARADERPDLSFLIAEAERTGLPASQYDLVFQRALVHHLADTGAVFDEAHRLLAPNGTLLIQDRTMDDVLRPGSAEHLRGYFFELFPMLASFEEGRRPTSTDIISSLKDAGFTQVKEHTIAERRRQYDGIDELRADLRARTGRSILHEISDADLDHLVEYIAGKIGDRTPIDEVDYWTVWSAKGAVH